MRSVRSSFVPAAVLCATSGLAIAVPTYAPPQIVVGVGAADPGELPAGSEFNSTAPLLNDQGVVAARYLSTEAELIGLWRGTVEGGEIIAEVPAGDGLMEIGDHSMNNAGDMVWGQTVQGLGVYRYDASEQSVEYFTNQPLGASSWGSAKLLEDGRFGARVSVGSGNAYIIVSADGSGYDIVAGDQKVLPTSDITWLFSPSFNDAGQTAGRVNLTGGGDQIRLYEPDGSHIVVATVGQQAPVTSTFGRFFNGTGIGPNGEVAFGARLSTGGSGIYYSDGAEIFEIARQGTGGFGGFGSYAGYISFAPAVNPDGLVAFRADLPDGRDVVAVWQDGETSIVATEGDTVTIDGVDYQIGDGGSDKPAFAHSVSINAAGQVVYHAVIRSGTEKVGEAILLSSPVEEPSCAADRDGDGDKDVQDLLSYLRSFRARQADMDGDTDTDVQDLLAYLRAFRAGC